MERVSLIRPKEGSRTQGTFGGLGGLVIGTLSSDLSQVTQAHTHPLEENDGP